MYKIIFPNNFWFQMLPTYQSSILATLLNTYWVSYVMLSSISSAPKCALHSYTDKTRVLPKPYMHSTKLYSLALLRVCKLYLCAVHSYVPLFVKTSNMAFPQFAIVVYFDQQTHVCACVHMVKNDKKSKMMKKYLFHHVLERLM